MLYNKTIKDGYREDLDKNFRSQMEANVYRYLTECHPELKLVEYEPKLFTEKDGMPRGVHYLPDFRCTTHSGSQFYIEVCPILDKHHKTKVEAFRRVTGHRLEVVDTVLYTRIKKYYAKKTRGWEGRV